MQRRLELIPKGKMHKTRLLLFSRGTEAGVAEERPLPRNLPGQLQRLNG